MTEYMCVCVCAFRKNASLIKYVAIWIIRLLSFVVDEKHVIALSNVLVSNPSVIIRCST